MFHQLFALNSSHLSLVRRAAYDEMPEQRRSVALLAEKLFYEKGSFSFLSQRKQVRLQWSGLLGMDMNLETPMLLLSSETD